jgi:hypothetical protein
MPVSLIVSVDRFFGMHSLDIELLLRAKRWFYV